MLPGAAFILIPALGILLDVPAVENYQSRKAYRFNIGYHV